MIIRLASTSKWSSFRASVYQVLSIYVIMVVFMLLILIMIKLHCCNWGWWQYFPQTTARLYSQTQVAQQQFLWSPGEAVWEGGEWLRLIVPALRWRSFFLKNRTSVILQMQIYLLMRSFGFWQYNLISGTQMTSICTTTWQGIFFAKHYFQQINLRYFQPGLERSQPWETTRVAEILSHNHHSYNCLQVKIC